MLEYASNSSRLHENIFASSDNLLDDMEGGREGWVSTIFGTWEINIDTLHTLYKLYVIFHFKARL